MATQTYDPYDEYKTCLIEKRYDDAKAVLNSIDKRLKDERACGKHPIIEELLRLRLTELDFAEKMLQVEERK